MAGNKTERRCWAYQSAVGTEAIDDATDTTYFFGLPDKTIDLSVPTIKTPTEEYYNYASREPTQTPLDPEYQTFMTPYYPTTAQHLVWMLKQVTEDGVSANVHEIEVLDSGLPLPLTIRDELKDGSVDRLFQAVDCYMIGLYWRAMINSPYFVECEWAYGRLEDKRGQWKFDDVVAAVNGGAKTIDLTTTGGTLNQYANWGVFVSGGTGEDEEYTIASNTAATPTVLTLNETPGAAIADTLAIFDKPRPILTTAPSAPGESATNLYDGRPEVYWDVDDQNVQLTECWKAEGQHIQEHTQVLDTDSKYATTYLYKHQPIALTLECVLERHKQVYDYIDRKANSINIKVYKPNTSYYLLKKLTGCEVIDWKETGHANKGHWNARIFIKASACVGNFTLESETNWSTHYKTV